MYVALAVRSYGDGRICIHTDGVGSPLTGHGANKSEFWRSILCWTSKKDNKESLRVALVVSVSNYSSERMNSFKPISIVNMAISDLFTADLSSFDCLYFAGLPSDISLDIRDKIESFVNQGGGLIIENPNRGDESINVLLSIEDLNCASSDRPLDSLAYWTIDGVDSGLFYADAKMSFMSTMMESDFSNYWTILMTELENANTTTTTTLGSVFGVSGKSSSDIILSFYVAMKNGIVEIEEL